MISDDAWLPRLAALVDRLTRSGDLRSAAGVLVEACDGSHAEVITDPVLDGQRVRRSVNARS